MKKVAIITGITGQDGAYLADFLLSKKYEVVGLLYSKIRNNFLGLNYFGITKKIKFETGSLLDENFLEHVIKKYKPDEFYNLAGQSSVAKSWQNPKETFQINTKSVKKILEIIKKNSSKTKFLQCSSAEIYGDNKKIITEKTNFFSPVNPYGESKLKAYKIVEKFRKKESLFAVNAVLFNHESPFRPDFIVTKKIIKGVLKISKNLEKKIILGNLKVKRDWGYAGDFVRAMWKMLQQKYPKDFIICTGKSHSLEEFLKEVFAQVGIKDWEKYVSLDKKFFREKDIKNMRGSSKLAQKELNWKPTVGLKELIKIMLDYEKVNL